MADNSKKPQSAKAKRLSDSASYSIGGKTYSALDVSRMQQQTKDVRTVTGMENTPRQAFKPLENQFGVINTSVGTMEAGRNVHVQEEAYRPSLNTQATVQSPGAPKGIPNKPNVSAPNNSAFNNPVFRGPAAGNPVLNNPVINNPVLNNPVVNSQIGSQIHGTPRMVDAIKTTTPMTGNPGASPIPHGGVNPPVSSSPTTPSFAGSAIPGTPRRVDAIKTTTPMTGRPGVPPISPEGVRPHTPGTPANPSFAGGAGPGIISSVQTTGNIRTGTQMATAVERKVQLQTDNFNSNNAYTAGVTKIHNEGYAVPNNVGGIQTGTAVPQGQKAAYKPFVPNIGAGKVGSIPLTHQQMRDLKIHMTLSGVTGNVTTGNMQAGANTARVYNFTSGAKSKLSVDNPLMNRFTKGTETNREYVRGLGVVAKYTVSTEMANALQKWNARPRSNDLLSSGKMLAGRAEGELLSKDDMGTQAVGGVVAVGMATVATYKMAQAATALGYEGIKVGVESVVKVRDGVYQVATTAGLTAITVGRTVRTMINRQTIPLSKETIQILREEGRASGLINTRIVQGIINRVERVKTAYWVAVGKISRVKNTLSSGVTTVRTAVGNGVRIVRGVANGTMTLNAAAIQLAQFKNRMVQRFQATVKRGVKTAAGFAVRGTAKAASAAVFRGVPLAGKMLKGSINLGREALTRSEDLGLQSVGAAITAAQIGVKGTKIGVKTAVTGAKATGYTVKTAVKTGRGIVSAIQYVRSNGLRAGARRLGEKVGQGIAQAGRSVVSAVIQGVKALGSKAVVPVLLIAVVLMMASGMLSSIVAGVGAIFGGVFNTKAEDGTIIEHDILEYMEDPLTGISHLMEEFAMELADELAEAQLRYDIVRFYSNSNRSGGIDLTLTGVKSAMEDEETTIKMLKPIFQAILVAEYNLEPTDEEAAALLKELFEALYKVTFNESVEQCGQDFEDGGGEVVIHDCGEVHALEDCFNPLEGFHKDYTCPDCDSYTCPGHANCPGHWYCPGHEGTYDGCRSEVFYCTVNGGYYCPGCKYLDTDGDGISDKVEYCSGCIYVPRSSLGCKPSYCDDPESCSKRSLKCTGYKNCGGHTVCTYVLGMKGMSPIIEDHFTKPIASLEAIPEDSRTEEQKEQLEDLKAGYEILMALMEEETIAFGGGMFMTPIRYDVLTSPFGWRYHPVYNYNKFHNGVDLAASEGTPIYATADGVVKSASYNDEAGNQVIIKHADGWQSGYAHMQYSVVTSGQEVLQGQLIGYCGNTGVSTGPHLHFNLKENGDYRDPEIYVNLSWRPGDDPITPKPTEPKPTEPNPDETVPGESTEPEEENVID